MSQQPEYEFETAEEFEAHLAAQRDGSAHGGRGGSGPDVLGIASKVLPVVLACGMAFLFLAPRSTSTSPREGRVKALSWIAWICGKEFDPDKNVFTKEVEIEWPTPAAVDVDNGFSEHLQREQRRRSNAISNGVRRMHNR